MGQRDRTVLMVLWNKLDKRFDEPEARPTI